MIPRVNQGATPVQGLIPLMGTLLAVALTFNLGTPRASAQVDQGDWIEVREFYSPDAAPSDQFGTALAFEDRTLAVGSPLDDDWGPDSGSVYIFKRNLGGLESWTLEDKIRAEKEETAGDMFGVSLSLHGDMLAVGADLDSPPDLPHTGAAYVSYRDTTLPKPWYQVCKRYPAYGANLDRYGSSVSLSEEHLLVGDPGDASGTGAAFLYGRNHGGMDGWGLVQKLVPGDAGTSFGVGRSVVVSQGMALLGVPRAWEGGFITGAVYVYVQGFSDDEEVWLEAAKLLAADGDPGDRFGQSVSLSGTTLAIGAHGDDDGQLNSGAVYVFERGPAGRADWQQVAKLKAPYPRREAKIGMDVEIDCDRIVVGAPQYKTAMNEVVGAVYVFERGGPGANDWTCTAELIASDANEYDAFGYAVAVQGAQILVSAKEDDDAGYNSGSVYCFALQSDPLILPLFADDFESGVTSAWSATVP